MQHTIKKSKTPQGIEPRPNKWECHHRSLLLFCCCCKGKSKTWRNKRIVPPGKENPFTMAATLSRHEGTFRDTRLQLEDRTTGFPPHPTPALPTTLHWQLIPCFLPYYWHDTTIPGTLKVALLLKFWRSHGTRKDSDDFLAYFAAVNGERETIYVPSPRPTPPTSTAGTRFSQNGHRLPQTSSVYCGYSSSATLNSSFRGNKTVP